jgi:predicted MFS family arabinose efflux permease
MAEKIGPLAPLRERQFVACFSSGILAASANWMLSLSVPFLVYEMTASETWLGLSAVASSAPAIIASPLGGVWADRYSKRLILLLSLSLQFTLASTLYWISRSGEINLTNLLCLASAMGFASQVNLSAYQSFVADIVPPRQIAPAYRLNAIQFNASRAIGPAIAGFVLAKWGPSTAFLINALAYLPLATVLLFVKPRRNTVGPSKSILSDLAEGARTSWNDPRLRLALMTVSISSIFGMSIQALMAGIAKDVFLVNEQGLGLLVSSIGISAVITAVAAVWLAEGIRRSTMVRVGLVFYGLGMWVVASTNIFAVGLAGFAITGFAHVLVNVSVTTAIQVHVPEALRGRVTSLQLMGIIVSMPIGAQVGGVLAESIGLSSVIALYGSALLCYAAWGHFKMDRLRALD